MVHFRYVSLLVHNLVQVPSVSNIAQDWFPELDWRFRFYDFFSIALIAGGLHSGDPRDS